MKAADFNYVRPNTLTEALNLISKADEDAAIISGGQSLIPMMNFRLVEPSTLIDISKLPELQKIEHLGATLEIGAGLTYAEIEKSDIVNSKVPLLAHAIEFIAHSAIRNRGTIGGSVALADPAAEIPALLIALNATIFLQSRTGHRLISADEFFLGTYETALERGEIVLKISIPSFSFKFKAKPFLFRFIIIKAADSPLISGGRNFLVSSPPGIFSIFITSAPRSASNKPQVGPAIICDNSKTRIP